MSWLKSVAGWSLLLVAACASSGGSGGGVDANALCNKCAQCFAQDPSFQEGYCDPFWDGSSFDTASCVQNADPQKLDSAPTATQLDSMSCAEFDDAV